MSATVTYKVPDISCEHCVNAITESVTAVAGVDTVEVDLDAKSVTVVGGANAEVITAIDDAGFDVAD